MHASLSKKILIRVVDGQENKHYKWKSLYLKYINMIQNKPLPPFKKRVIIVNESCKRTFQYLESKQWNQ